MMAIIGGSGLTGLQNSQELKRHDVTTPWGKPSSPVAEVLLAGKSALFLARHGQPHCIPPHRVNYRANIAALKALGADQVVSVNAVGAINPVMGVTHLNVPDQIIDYSYGREHTFFDGDASYDISGAGFKADLTGDENQTGFGVTHIDFSSPYSANLRHKLTQYLQTTGFEFSDSGTYGCTQGPRLESVAEIKRMARDGCDIVGMTGMPEAALAREAGLEYACLALIVNPAAGLGNATITLSEIEQAIAQGMDKVKQVLAFIIASQ